MLKTRPQSDLTESSSSPKSKHLQSKTVLRPHNWKLTALDFCLVLGFSLFMCLYRIGDYSFGGGDQTTHSVAVQNMLKTGDFLTPIKDGGPYFNKPPFKMWLATIPVALLGESNFSYRAIDGLCGSALALVVYFFSLSLFRSRACAYSSLFALMGCNLLFFGHGIRNATQDVMMLLLVTIGVWIGWNTLETWRELTPNSREAKKLLLTRAAIIGGFVGLAILTKNVAGLTAFFILGTYFLTQPQLVKRTKEVILPGLLALVLSLLPIGIYILLQGKYSKLAFSMLMVTEVYKRATKGYHFVNHHYYYLRGIFSFNMICPAVLFSLGLLNSGYLAIRRRDNRAAFLFCWSVFPVLLFSVMKSKLMWYILPAVPGMCLLVGHLLGTTIEISRKAVKEWFHDNRLPQLTSFACCLFSIYGVYALGHNVERIAQKNLSAKVRVPVDEMIEDILKAGNERGKPFSAVTYTTLKLAQHENLYWNMLNNERNVAGNIEQIRKRLQDSPPDFLLIPASMFKEVAALHPINGYAFFPPKYRRQKWIAAISYVPNFTPRHLLRADQKFSAVSPDLNILYGLSDSQRPFGFPIRVSEGDKSTFLLPGNPGWSRLGAEITLNIAAVSPTASATKDGKPLPVQSGELLYLDLILNEEKIGRISDIEEGFHRRSVSVNPQQWQREKNLLSLHYGYSDGRGIGDKQTVLLFESVTVSIPKPTSDKMANSEQ